QFPDKINAGMIKHSSLLFRHMPADRFISDRKTSWERLEELLRRRDNASIRRLHREEVSELGRSYRRAASDLAIARAESRDPRLVNYLNNLVIRAHGRIYRADAQGTRRIVNFFARDFPQTFRRTWRYTALAFGVFTLFCFIGFVGTWKDIEFSELMGVPAGARERILQTKPHWWEELNKENQVGASEIFTNNIRVTFYTFAAGALFGIGTLFVVAYNGAINAALLAVVFRAGYGKDLLTFMAGHGVVELSCIFIAGGAGLMVGSGIVLPGDLSRAD